MQPFNTATYYTNVKTLHLDNSAISLLHCKRRFQLTVIEGKQTLSNEIADHGNAIHVMLEFLDKGHSVEQTIAHVREKYPNVNHGKVISVVTMYKTLNKLPPPLTLASGAPAVEVKFDHPYTSVSTPAGLININLTGTIDRIHMDKDTLVIMDYKSGVASTDYQITKSIAGYDLTFQLPFYLYAAKLSGILPAEYRTLIHEHQYRTEIHCLYYNASPPVTRKKIFPPYPSDFIDREVPYIIDAKIKEAIEIASLDIPAPHDGMNVYGACSYCPYKAACLSMGTAREAEYLASFESKPYNPLEFR